MLARTIPIPVSASAAVTIESARSPPVKSWAAARITAKSTPSIALRATRSAAIVGRALDRRTARSDPQAVHRDVGRAQPGAHAVLGLVDREREDPMMRTAE